MSNNKIETNTEKEAEYWNGFYKNDAPKLSIDIPSQFAVFFLNEISAEASIIDFGCGGGRDSMFFAETGRTVLGVDSSSAAIELCKKKAEKNGLRSASFHCLDLGREEVSNELGQLTGDTVALYARFFLHAIDDALEEQFLKTASALVKGSSFGLEFRTNMDANLQKVTDTHYRRYVNPIDFILRAKDYGFVVSYFAQGFGFAKFKNDDAHVARIIFQKS